MPDSPFLSVEQRDDWERYFCGVPLLRIVQRVLESHAEADRREAELREDLEISKANVESEVRNAAWEAERANNLTDEVGSLRIQLAAKDAEIAEWRAALALIYDAWENGTPCFEDVESMDGSLGNAFKLDYEDENKILGLLNGEALAATPPAPKSPGLPAPLVLCVVCRKVIVGVGDTCRTCATTPPAKEEGKSNDAE